MEATLKSNKEDQNKQLEGKFPCPLCHTGLEIKLSKRKKPYCTCLICGIQLFFRGKEGIERLREYSEKDIFPNLADYNSLTISNKSRKVIMILDEMKQIKGKIGEIEEGKGFWEDLFGKEEKKSVLKFLQNELQHLSGQLKTFSRNNR